MKRFSCLLAAFMLMVPAMAQPTPVIYTVDRVVDGDTIKLTNGDTVRLIGVDTPETVHPNKPVEAYGKEASNFTKWKAEGKNIRLEYDADTKDQFQRVLAYVYLPDGTCLNETIIAEGYGMAFTQYPFSRMEHYRNLEKKAQDLRLGLWSAAPKGPSVPLQDITVYVTSSGTKYHSRTCPHASGSGKPMKISHAKTRGLTPCTRCQK